MSDQKKAAAAGTSDGTIIKPFLIDGGRFIVELDVSDLKNVMFSIRGEIDSEKIHEVLIIAENHFRKIINERMNYK